MTHEQLVSICFQWHWNTFPEERRMLYGVNNNSANRIEGNRNKAKGVVAGVLDFCYISWWSVIWLDAKVGKDVLSEEQKDFIKKAEERGQRCYIFSSLEEFKKIITLCQKNSGK
jgi:hypothetical protein